MPAHIVSTMSLMVASACLASSRIRSRGKDAGGDVPGSADRHVEQGVRCGQRDRAALAAAGTVHGADVLRAASPATSPAAARAASHAIAGSAEPNTAVSTSPLAVGAGTAASGVRGCQGAGMFRRCGSSLMLSRSSRIADDTVGERVVDLGVDGVAAVGEALDQVHLPQRAAAVEQGAVQPRHQRHQFGHAARPGQRVAAHVVLEIHLVVREGVPAPLAERGDRTAGPLAERRRHLVAGQGACRTSRAHRPPTRPLVG